MLHGLVRHVDSIDRCESPVWSAGQVAVQLRKLQFILIMVYLYLSLSCRDPANALTYCPTWAALRSWAKPAKCDILHPPLRPGTGLHLQAVFIVPVRPSSEILLPPVPSSVIVNHIPDQYNSASATIPLSDSFCTLAY